MSLSVWQRWTAGTVCALAMATAAYAQTTPYATINNPSGPVKNLFVGNDLSVQITSWIPVLSRFIRLARVLPITAP